MKVRKTTGIAAALLIAALAVASVAVASERYPTYELQVVFDLPQAKLIGAATIDVPQGKELSIDRGDLRILWLRKGGRRISPDTLESDTFTLRAEGPLHIGFEGTFTGSERDVIDQDKIVLRGIWYPVVEGTYRYRLTATLPRDFVAVSEADRVRRTEANGQATFTFDLPYPQRDDDGITFVASTQWASRDAKYKDIELSIHMLRRNAGRLDEMMRQAQRYLQRLEGLLGDYPFRRLAIVENPFPLHYSLSMPTYILLAQESVGAEASENSALNHEIAHAWFGNGVLADYDGGNWAEGLASYFSDHLEHERLGYAWERRQRMMAGYQNNVAEEATLPLSNFTESSDFASRITGYAKSAIVFHMLRRLLGDERFFAAMRKFVKENLFSVASWTDIRKAFEREAAMDLGWFFHQWVDGAATPELSLEKVSVQAAGEKHELRLTVIQKPPVFALAVPVTIHFERGRSETALLHISDERHEFRYSLNEKPVRVVLDESYDVFRRLTPAEIPPTINTLLTRPRVTLVAPPGEQAKFGRLIDAFEGEGPAIAVFGWDHAWPRKDRQPIAARLRQPGETTTRQQRRMRRAVESGAATETSATSLILLGENNPLIAKLFGRVDLPRGGFTITVLKHPRSPGDVVAIVTAVSKAEVDAGYGKLIDRPRYSTAAFNGGKLTYYELRSGQRGISAEVTAEPR